ncbi:restriction endonuclease subunit S [Chitinophaga cymbidii]|uniref:Type I restriction-modification enzyme, S subunit n=1 Tax=Chitinophaga cymbidii TaxID=1096750 RepID=A0A512RM67_9BACT|nr:restriction endonuclease subunit S [Chitinophaga cymbidii]GEP96759.1 type I restriction-modification enzyme, S subunit [Chitinophaga cymbidii]
MSNKTIPNVKGKSITDKRPQGWKAKRLGDLVNIISGNSPDKQSLHLKGIYPYLKVEDLNNNSKYQKTSREYTDLEKNLIPEYSIIFPKRGAAILNNKVRISKVKAQIDSNLMAIFPLDEQLDSEFLYYKISQIELYKIADTSTIPQINNKHIIPYKVLLPPISEQQSIVKILASWDEALSITQNLISALQNRNKGLMQQLLTGKRRIPAFAKKKWRKLAANEVFKSISNKNTDGEILLSATQDKGIIPRTMLEARVTMPTGDVNSFKLVERGDFVISLRSFQGGIEYSEYRGIVSPAYTVLKPKREISPRFYKHYFKSYDFIGHLAVAVIGIRDGKQVSYEDFSMIKLPHPSLEEQDTIASVLDDASREIEYYKSKLEYLQQQKKYLMQKLLTGEVRVKTPEPAA